MTQGKYIKYFWVIHEIFLKANNEEKTALTVLRGVNTHSISVEPQRWKNSHTQAVIDSPLNKTEQARWSSKA